MPDTVSSSNIAQKAGTIRPYSEPVNIGGKALAYAADIGRE